MAEAPAPPPANAGLDAAEPPKPRAPAAAVSAQLQKLMAQAIERNTAVRTHVAQRAETAIAAMNETLADLLVVANQARTAAAVVPGLHNVAHALHDLYAQSRAVQPANFEPEWQAALKVMALANADEVAALALVDQAAVVDAPLAPLALDESNRPKPVWPPPPRKWHISNGDDEDDVEEHSEPDFVFDIHGPLLEDDEDDKDYVPDQDSDDDIDYDSDSFDEDPDNDMSTDAGKHSNTSGDKDPGVSEGAPKNEGAKWQEPMTRARSPKIVTGQARDSK
ncbi:hypothetical protein GGF31_008555 [Allomyces arbusculus]|nr:hypothetical protein GGF31_008555 [Allomyces arbusculus]